MTVILTTQALHKDKTQGHIVITDFLTSDMTKTWPVKKTKTVHFCVENTLLWYIKTLLLFSIQIRTRTIIFECHKHVANTAVLMMSPCTENTELIFTIDHYTSATE